MQKDLFFDAPAREIKEKLLVNRFTAFGVEYRPKLDTAPENAMAAIRYDTTNLFSPIFYNSCTLDLKAVVYEAGEGKRRIHLEADLKHIIKVMSVAILILVILIEIVLNATGAETREFGFLVPALIVLSVIVHFLLGKKLNFQRIEREISRICSE